MDKPEKKTQHKLTSSGDGFIRDVDESLEHWLGYKTGALKGQPLTKIIPRDYRTAHMEAMTEYLSSGEKTVMGSWVRVAILNANDLEVPIKFVVTEDDDGLVAIFETDG